MNRIEQTFAELKKSGRKGLVGYLTAGDPDLEQSNVDIRAAVENGLDLLELGVPFSDPTADGPTIQEASQRALASGMDLEKALAMVVGLRKESDIPVVLFGYANPIFRYGYERLCADAADAGVDGLLIVDLPHEEMQELNAFAEAKDLCLIPLIAPTTPPERASEILRDARGFVYYIMVTGVTGARDSVAPDIAPHVAALRTCTDLPIAVGFGVSRGEQARTAGENADAVVVGSALVRAARAGNLSELVRELHDALGGDDG
ncbi:MAG: tryptophan synthase subunit alpha [Lentisphaerae bacterium]|nr:tryptophan synthase subunit alpha [Lentisphaerota bacterium]